MKNIRLKQKEEIDENGPSLRNNWKRWLGWIESALGKFFTIFGICEVPYRRSFYELR